MKESRITYSDLVSVDLSSFGSAVADWNRVQSELKTRASEAENDMNRKARNAHWEGVNADAVRPFVRKIAEEVEDLRREAESIWNLMDDAHQELADIQKDVEAEKEKAHKLRVHIQDNGDGTVTCEFRRGTDAATTASGYYVGGSGEKRTSQEREARDAIESRLNYLIGKAREIDTTSARYIAKSHGADKHDAGHATYKSLDDAQAREATRLAKKELQLAAHGRELSTPDLQRLRDLTKYNAKDAEFATRFYRELGPEQALRLHGQLGVDASTGGGDTRRELSRTIQNSLDAGLALATHPGGGKDGNSDHLGSAWTAELKKAGKQPVLLHDPQSNEWGKNAMSQQKVLGYQVLGNMLRHGKYDKDFLNSVGKDMVETERRNDLGPAGWPNPHNARRTTTLNLDPHGGTGYDPMTGLLKGLSHNPDAATEFFNAYTGDDEQGPKEMANFDYFFGDQEGSDPIKPREWPPDGDDDSAKIGKDALGGALEAATTGRPPGDEGPPLKHTEDQAELFHRVVERLGGRHNAPLVEHGGDLEPLQSHMGNMAADYMRDVQRGTVRVPEGLIAMQGADAELGTVENEALGRFLRTASQDPDGYAAITHASHAVSAEALRNSMQNPAGDASVMDAAVKGAEPGAQVAAEAAAGRADGIEAAEDKVGAAERYNESLDKKQELVGQVVDMGLGRLTYGSEAAGQVAGAVQEAVFDHYRKDPEEIAHQVEEQRRDFLASERKREAETMEKIARVAGAHAGVKGDALDWAATDVANAVADDFPKK
ncbi:hypothetical protein ITI46_26890 [Streptomyces oryzae]|uniref:AG2 protein n=1 Tax=Streptomyces oryzae TaxID=1434886 RepID=A0ABS3XIV2_9ACTN|nr:hypothetical protein [Streptomyces oryzae]MBO8195248.1 hypothetical protein [Streptomyces oryzae]